jgi:hypothetical protein
MNVDFILEMARRTVNLPPYIDSLVREIADQEHQSYSATVARLIDAGSRALRGPRVPAYVGVGEGGPEDLSIDAEKYLRELAEDS